VLVDIILSKRSHAVERCAVLTISPVVNFELQHKVLTDLLITDCERNGMGNE
jgi:hypothetical protein